MRNRLQIILEQVLRTLSEEEGTEPRMPKFPSLAERMPTNPQQLGIFTASAGYRRPFPHQDHHFENIVHHNEQVNSLPDEASSEQMKRITNRAHMLVNAASETHQGLQVDPKTAHIVYQHQMKSPTGRTVNTVREQVRAFSMPHTSEDGIHTWNRTEILPDR
jgi:hypothetical protein